MNSTPETTGIGSARRPIKPTVWWALVAAALFVVLCISALVLDSQQSVPSTLMFAAVVSLVLTLCAVALVVFLRWVRSWQNVSRLLFGLVCAVTLIALAYAIENWRGRSAWQNHRRALEAAGEPFALERLVPPQVPDQQNFAMTPLLTPLLDLTNTPTGVVWHDTNAMNRLNGLSAELRPERHTNDHLTLGNLEKGTLADLEACAEFYRGNTNYPQAAPDAAPAERILVALGKFELELEELRNAAADRPYGRFPVQYNTEPSWAILLPHLARVKALGLMVNVRAIAELDAGRGAEAFEDFKLALRLSESIKDEPILISHLVRVATLSITLQTLREALARHAWNEAQLAELQKRLQSIDLLAEYKHAMRGERALSVEGLDYLRRHGPRNVPLDDLPAGNWLFLYPSGWMYQNMLRMSRLHQEFTLPAVDEAANRVNPEVLERGARHVEAMRRGPYTIFATLMLPAISKTAVRPAQVQTFVDAARVSCAIERFRLAQGKLPANLEALVPQLLSAVPNDVIDGKPLRFHTNADGTYTLYSVGWNGADNAGEVALKNESKEAMAEIAQGDWVWRVL